MKINRTFNKNVALGRLVLALSLALTSLAFGAEGDVDWKNVADGFPLLYSRDGDNLESIWRSLENGDASEPFADAVDFQLRRQGARYRGKLLAVSGRLLRCARETAPNGTTFYDLWVLLPDSQRDPIRILARNAPAGFLCDPTVANATPYPRDVEYRHEQIAARALYYRSTSYNAGDDFYTAPTLVALDFATTGGGESSDEKGDSSYIWREILKPKPARILGIVLIWLAIRNYLRRRRAARKARQGLATRADSGMTQDGDKFPNYPKLLLTLALAASCVAPVVGEEPTDSEESFWASLAGGTLDEWRAETNGNRARIDAEEPECVRRRALASTALGRMTRAITPGALAERAPSLRGTLREFVVGERAREAVDEGADSRYFCGRIAAIEPIELNEAERERSGLERVFRIELTRESDSSLVLYAGALPQFNAPNSFFDGGKRASETASDLGERVGGVAVRFGAEADASGKFVPCALTPKLSWFPEDAPLGRVGVDLASFAAVRVYAPTALDGATDPTEKRAIARSLRWTTDDSAPFYESLAATANATEFGGVAAKDVVSLFNRPERLQGASVSLRGWARRVNMVVVTDADARAATGLNRYYQIYLFTNESQGRPITLCVAELPDGLTPGGGREYRRELDFSGFFYKTWAYRDSESSEVEGDGDSLASSPKGAWTSSPVLVGRITRVAPAEPPSRSPVAPGTIFTLFFALACAWIVLRRFVARRRVVSVRRRS